jgi:ParB family chromosome partitioning protein
MRHRPGEVRRVLADRARDPLFGLSDGLPRLVEIDLARIRANPDQPRQRIDAAGIEELAASIERHGLLQPILVREEGPDYMLVAGQRRLLACQRLGRASIAALLTTGRPDELALIENLQREDLSPLEEAEALAVLKERHGYTQEALGRVLGKAKSTVSELLSLNDLPPAVKARARTGELPLAKSVLIELARLGDEPAILAALRTHDAARRPTVRTARAARRGRGGGAPDGRELHAAGTRLLRALDALPIERVREDAALQQLLRTLQGRLAVLLEG